MILVENISKFVENNVIKWKFYNCFPVFVCIMRLKFTKLHVLYDFFKKKKNLIRCYENRIFYLCDRTICVKIMVIYGKYRIK